MGQVKKQWGKLPYLLPTQCLCHNSDVDRLLNKPGTGISRRGTQGSTKIHGLGCKEKEKNGLLLEVGSGLKYVGKASSSGAEGRTGLGKRKLQLKTKVCLQSYMMTTRVGIPRGVEEQNCDTLMELIVVLLDRHHAGSCK